MLAIYLMMLPKKTPQQFCFNNIISMTTHTILQIFLTAEYSTDKNNE